LHTSPTKNRDRYENEPLGARLAAEHASDADLTEMADVLKRAKHWASLRNVETAAFLQAVEEDPRELLGRWRSPSSG